MEKKEWSLAGLGRSESVVKNISQQHQQDRLTHCTYVNRTDVAN